MQSLFLKAVSKSTPDPFITHPHTRYIFLLSTPQRNPPSVRGMLSLRSNRSDCRQLSHQFPVAHAYVDEIPSRRSRRPVLDRIRVKIRVVDWSVRCWNRGRRRELRRRPGVAGRVVDFFVGVDTASAEDWVVQIDLLINPTILRFFASPASPPLLR